MDSPECDYEILGGYLPSFLDHLEETRARLGLSSKSAVGIATTVPQPTPRGERTPHTVYDYDTPDSRPSLSESANAPHTLSPWTEPEYAALFRALSVYSRWRPDLIAACVPTRSTWEVSLYLEALEEGAAQLAALENESESGGITREQKTSRTKNKGKGKAVELDIIASDGDMDTSSPSSCSSSELDSDSEQGQSSDIRTWKHPYAGHKPAHEVSSPWVAAEESMAAWIVREDWLARSTGSTGQALGAVSDAEEDIEDAKPPKRRRRGRPRGSGKRRGRSRAGQAQKHAVSRSPSKDLSPVRKKRKSRSAREDVLGRLEEAHLVVLDAMLREAEEADCMRSTEGSQVPLGEQSITAPECGGRPEHAKAVKGTEPHLEDNRDIGETSADVRVLNAGAVVVPDSVIDPMLLELSRVPSENTSSIPSPTRTPAPIPTSRALSFPTENPLSLSEPPFPNVVNAPQLPRQDTNPDMSHLSPRSRRRLQKRLYMRRRRALLRAGSQAREGADESVITVYGLALEAGGRESEDKSKICAESLSLERLKPGKKAKFPTPTSSVPPSAPASGAPSDVESESESHAARKEMDTENPGAKLNQRGLTLPYKLKAAFAELGIDAAYLRAKGMDLLHLGALGKLMGLYTSLEYSDDEDEGEDVAPSAWSIDSQLIQYLQAMVVLFVTEVVHRAIVRKESEVMLKNRSRAWRGSDQIGVSAVEHALATVGSRYHSHREYFSSLLSFYDAKNPSEVTGWKATSSPAPLEGETEPVCMSDAHLGANAENLSAAPPVLSCHRDIYTPIIHPPSAWAIPPIDCFSRTYTQEAKRTKRGQSKDVYDEDDLMPDETDEEALEAELREDDRVDRQDMQTAKEFEERLWKVVQHDARGALTDDDDDDDYDHSLL